MSGFYGGDTEQMRQHATACTGGARRLAELIGNATSTVESVTWEGPDADTFREGWWSGPQSRADSLADQLQDLARRLEEHAEQQDEVSSADGGGILGGIGIILPFPLPFPIPGLPLTPGILGGLGGALQPGGPGTGGQSFYGDPGYGPGNAASNQQEFGPATAGGSHWDGREIENERGYVDGYANTRANAGGSITTDQYGNTTYAGGARAGMEIGVDEMVNLPGGGTYQTDARVGAEAYLEGGITVGPDGSSMGVSGGVGAYGDIQGTLTGPNGASATIGVEGYAGAEAHLNSYAHATRNEDGDVNGFTFGSDGGAFAGAQADLDFGGTAPGGWLSGSGSVGVETGVGGNAGFGGTVSTDEVGFSVSGDVAALIGVNGSLSLSIHPNEIVNDILPGDYDLDDILSDAEGAFDAVTDFAGDALSAINPFD